MAPLRLPYEQLVFSGGGLRCFWHGGFLEVAAADRTLEPERVTGSSGGALSAAVWIADREIALRDRFEAALAEEGSNFSLDDADDEAGRSAHQRVYGQIIEDVLDDASIDRIANGPAFQVSVSTPGNTNASTLRALLGGTLYQAEQWLAPTPRPRLGHLTGMEQRLIDARAAARDGTLRDLVRMAATVPPAFRPDDWNGEPVFDGGMVDKAPLPDPDSGATLVLLTKRFRSLPDDEGGRVVYIQPSDDVLPGQKLDFTDSGLPRIAWGQGRDDGRRWRNKII